MSADVGYRRLELADMAAASRVFRSTFDQRLPWPAGLHTPDEDLAFWRRNVFSTDEIWGAEQVDELLGVITFRRGWVEQLYILPAVQGQRIGSRLPDLVKDANDELSLSRCSGRTPALRRFIRSRGGCAHENGRFGQ